MCNVDLVILLFLLIIVFYFPPLLLFSNLDFSTYNDDSSIVLCVLIAGLCNQLDV